ncbi:hypothetical protein SAMN05216276_101663 [Streptosporangium subroseum]|uniref:Uncharacterized protein n=1 Tax=Streptosporangium subroseum TaxID=106412 RepID=A0A239HCQ4_9ACTN|nr:hypothetical protein SAMN05216276_101663 [Streptosporangium subroseum]
MSDGIPLLRPVRPIPEPGGHPVGLTVTEGENGIMVVFSRCVRCVSRGGHPQLAHWVPFWPPGPPPETRTHLPLPGRMTGPA